MVVLRPFSGNPPWVVVELTTYAACLSLSGSRPPSWKLAPSSGVEAPFPRKVVSGRAAGGLFHGEWRLGGVPVAFSWKVVSGGGCRGGLFHGEWRLGGVPEGFSRKVVSGKGRGRPFSRKLASPGLQETGLTRRRTRHAPGNLEEKLTGQTAAPLSRNEPRGPPMEGLPSNEPGWLIRSGMPGFQRPAVSSTRSVAVVAET